VTAATVISRRVASVPVRTSVGTWTAIMDLLTEAGRPARASLEAIGNIAATLIAEEYTRDAPIVVMPATGPRIRIYTVHGTAAIEDGSHEAALAIWPLTESGWRISLPCGIDEIDAVRAMLRPYPYAEVRDATDGITAESTATAAAASGIPAPRAAGGLMINDDEMGRP
jgi:hypothetical protein